MDYEDSVGWHDGRISKHISVLSAERSSYQLQSKSLGHTMTFPMPCELKSIGPFVF